MRFVLKLEAIGDSHTYRLKNIHRYSGFDRRMLNAMRFGNDDLSVWVRRVGDQKLEPEYIDYTHANHDGNRGILKVWFLAPGRYEVNKRLSLTESHRYFLEVYEDGTANEV